MVGEVERNKTGKVKATQLRNELAMPRGLGKSKACAPEWMVGSLRPAIQGRVEAEGVHSMFWTN